MTQQEALDDIATAFLQLEFNIKLLSYSKLGFIDPAEFDMDHVVDFGADRLCFPSGQLGTQEQLERAAATNILVAMSASALTLDDAFNAFGQKPKPGATDEAGQLRVLVYMVRCAYAHGIADPLWEVRGKYLRTLALNLEGVPLTLDLSTLHGQSFLVTQIGGYPYWYRMRNAALRLLK
jgi:hypothetical protein